ncbi:hypothetical protein [Parasediminibacterium sp. JCM 36343]|uniref:hypothetical protein n=1 Tax=Parasediminibacterium sp. JCM 36343 TaxID=3374279 RepID=UPI00397AFAEB
MNQIKFTADERKLLEEVLQKRLDTYALEPTPQKTNRSKVPIQGKTRYKEAIISVLDKILKDDAITLNRVEKIICRSCIKEYHDGLHPQLYLPTVIAWLTITDHQIQLVRQLDMCSDILVKCSIPDKSKPFIKFHNGYRLGNQLAKIEKIKQCDKILLSKAGLNDIYKIAFVYQDNAYLTLNLKENLSLAENEFVQLDGQSLEKLAASKFTMLTTKDIAKTMLALCEPYHYPENVLESVGILLD